MLSAKKVLATRVLTQFWHADGKEVIKVRQCNPEILITNLYIHYNEILTAFLLKNIFCVLITKMLQANKSEFYKDMIFVIVKK
jgi:hypothetical protein